MTVSACGSKIKLSQEAKPRTLKPGENLLSFKTQGAGSIEWQCENSKTQGRFEVVEAAPEKAPEPTSLIEDLMIKSDEVIERLRKQLHPMMHGI